MPFSNDPYVFSHDPYLEMALLSRAFAADPRWLAALFAQPSPALHKEAQEESREPDDEALELTYPLTWDPTLSALEVLRMAYAQQAADASRVGSHRSR